MCFTPAISLTTAIIEFILATILLVFFPKTHLRNFFAVFIYWLGSYQLSEFFICTTSYSVFWGSVGVVLYSFLPALALYGVLKMFKKRTNLFLIYVVPVVVLLMVIFVSKFVDSTQCLSFVVIINTMLFSKEGILSLVGFFIYVGLYYFGFIVAIGYVVLGEYAKERNKIRKEIEAIIFIAVLLMTVPMLILAIVFPAFGIRFPSVLCEFAILVALCAFIVAYLETKLKKKFL